MRVTIVNVGEDAGMEEDGCGGVDGGLPSPFSDPRWGGVAVDRAQTDVGNAVPNGIWLTIVSAQDLGDAYWQWLDPYVLVEVVGKPDATFKTSVLSNKMHPV